MRRRARGERVLAVSHSGRWPLAGLTGTRKHEAAGCCDISRVAVGVRIMAADRGTTGRGGDALCNESAGACARRTHTVVGVRVRAPPRACVVPTVLRRVHLVTAGGLRAPRERATHVSCRVCARAAGCERRRKLQLVTVLEFVCFVSYLWKRPKPRKHTVERVVSYLSISRDHAHDVTC